MATPSAVPAGGFHGASLGRRRHHLLSSSLSRRRSRHRRVSSLSESDVGQSLSLLASIPNPLALLLLRQAPLLRRDQRMPHRRRLAKRHDLRSAMPPQPQAPSLRRPPSIPRRRSTSTADPLPGTPSPFPHTTPSHRRTLMHVSPPFARSPPERMDGCLHAASHRSALNTSVIASCPSPSRSAVPSVVDAWRGSPIGPAKKGRNFTYGSHGLKMWIKSSCSLTTQVWLPLGQSPPISISKPPTDRCGIKRPYGRIPVINNWLREGQRRMRRSTARCNKLTRNRRQGLCVVRAARRATQFARVGWCCELQGASCGRMDPQDYES
uniref:Uncharacterized protein n=1 Tax=Oryza nivara TaxID=4536 RepID=A0A0E0HC17_ORYNI